MIQCESSKDEIITINEYSKEMESFLSENIDKCLKNKRFEKLQISIHRIIKKSDIKNISSDLLFNFISKSIRERCILFSFIDIQKLNDEKLKEISEKYENEEENNYFQYLPINFKYINSLRIENSQCRKRIKELEILNQQLQTANKELELENKEIKKRKRSNY